MLHAADEADETQPVLYTFNLSVWSAVTDIARYACLLLLSRLYWLIVATSVELKLADKIDTKTISVLEAENTSPEYIKIVRTSYLHLDYTLGA